MTSPKFFIPVIVLLIVSGPAFAQKRELGGHKAIKSHFTEAGGFDTVHAGSNQTDQSKKQPRVQVPADHAAVQTLSVGKKG